MNYYERLNINESASPEEIKKAYRKLAKQLHPDMNPDRDTTQEFVNLEVAYSCLSNKHSRLAYDQLLRFEREKINNPAMNQKYAQTIRRRTGKRRKRAQYHSNLSYKQYKRDELLMYTLAPYIKGSVAVIVALIFFWMIADWSNPSVEEIQARRNPSDSKKVMDGIVMWTFVLPVPSFILLSYMYEPIIKYLIVGKPKRRTKGKTGRSTN